MKLSLLILLLTTLSISMFAQATFRNCAQSEKAEEIKFPIVTLSGNVSASNRINDFLQMNYADQTLAKINESNLFDQIVYDYSENGSSGSITSLNYEVKTNHKAVVSMLFHGETMGAYPDFFDEGLNFNASTGDLFTLEDICTTEGFKKLASLIFSKRKQKIKAHLNSLLKDKDNKDAVKEYELESEFNECITTYVSYNFVISEHGLTMLHPRCLPHVIQALEGDFSVQLDNNTLKPFLNSYGKKLLLDKIPVKEAFHQNGYNHLMYGKIGNSPIAIYFDRVYKNEISAYYFYLSQGKKINGLGEINQSTISLKCDSDSDETIQEIIEGRFQKSTFTGTWRRKSDPVSKSLSMTAQ